MEPNSFEGNSNIVIPDANQGNNGAAGQAASMTASDWNLIQNWFQTDLACTMPDCREPGIYSGYCLYCNHMLLCIPHRVSVNRKFFNISRPHIATPVVFLVQFYMIIIDHFISKSVFQHVPTGWKILHGRVL